MSKRRLVTEHSSAAPFQPFSKTLRAAALPEWSATVSHSVTDAWGDGSLSAKAMAWYLVQDYKFLDGLVVPAAATSAGPSAASCPVLLSENISGISATYKCT